MQPSLWVLVMLRLTAIEAQYSREIEESADRFGDHEDMSAGRVLKWLGQFSDAHLPLATKVLINTKYYNASNIRAMTRELVISVLQNLRGVDRKQIFFVPVGVLGSSSTIIARVLRELSRTGATSGIKVVWMTDLEKVEPDKVSTIVFVDDFSGTGDQLSEWWVNVEQMIRPKKANVIVALLVMNSRARARIEEFANLAISIEELDDRANVLSAQNRVFSRAEKKMLLEYCLKTGCADEYARGRGSCGLILAFRHGCPNNSLPILWHSSRRWHALFLRHAL